MAYLSRIRCSRVLLLSVLAFVILPGEAVAEENEWEGCDDLPYEEGV